MRDAIIQKVFNNGAIEGYCKTLNYDNWDELRQELIIQLCNMKETSLIEADARGFLDYLCFKIIKRIVWGTIKDSGLFYKRSGKITELKNAIEVADDNEYNDGIDSIWEIVEHTHWYDKFLFKAYYIEGLTLKQIETKYGINQKSIHYTIKKTREKIKKQLKDDRNNHRNF